MPVEARESKRTEAPRGDRSAVVPARVLDAAEQLFAERGVTNTGMRALANAAGVSVTALYYHFESKQAVVRALLARVSEEQVDALPTELPGPLAERVRARAMAEYDRLRARPTLSWFVARETVAGDAEAVLLFDEFADAWMQRWEILLAGASDLAPGADVRGAAEVIRAALWGSFTVHLGHRGTYDVTPRIDALSALVAAGLGSREPPPRAEGDAAQQ